MSTNARAFDRIWRRVRRAYHLTCASEDAHRLGLETPDGVWFCAPCRLAVLDSLEMARHIYAHPG